MSLTYVTSTILFALTILPFQCGLLFSSSSNKSRYGDSADNVSENVSGYGLGWTILVWTPLDTWLDTILELQLKFLFI